jgi:hypothetical protein
MRSESKDKPSAPWNPEIGCQRGIRPPRRLSRLRRSSGGDRSPPEFLVHDVPAILSHRSYDCTGILYHFSFQFFLYHSAGTVQAQERRVKMVVLARVMAVSATPRPHPRPLNPHSRPVSSSSRWCMGAAQLSKGIHALGLSPCMIESFSQNAGKHLKADSHEGEFGTQNPAGLLYNKIQSLYLLAKIVSTCKRIQRILLPHHPFSCHEFVFRRAACRDAPFVLPTHYASLRCLPLTHPSMYSLISSPSNFSTSRRLFAPPLI